MSVTFKNLTPMLQTSDVAGTTKWYESVLGFNCTGRREDSWGRLERDGTTLMFMKNDHLGEPMATITQYIYVDDAQALFDQVKHRVTSEWGPELTPYGLLEFAIKDPNGYFLSFGQIMEKHSNE